jgi:RNA polymerase primary sigma factor
MSRYGQDQGRTVRVPVHMLERIIKARRVSEALRVQTGVEPTPQELAASLETDVLSVERVLAADLEIVSFDDSGCLLDEDAVLPSPLVDEATPLTALLHDDLRLLLAASLRQLDARQARIINLRFGLTDGNPLTLEEVGQVYRVTRERIRQIEAKSLKRLPHLLPNRQFENLVP